MIRVENVSYSVKGKKLISDISLSFLPDEISMIIGANGAGKSTLIKVLSKQIAVSEGNVYVEDQELGEIQRADFARRAAVLSQNIEISFPLSVEEIVMMGRYPHFRNKPRPVDKEVCEEAIDFFNVRPLLGRNYLTLSGGERQRVNFARVAAQIWPESREATKVKLLFLDEPLTYLDIYYQYEFLEKLKQLMGMQSMIVVGVVHDLNLAYQYAHQVVLLHQGELVTHGAGEEVFTREHIKNAFHLEPSLVTNEVGERFLCFRPNSR